MFKDTDINIWKSIPVVEGSTKVTVTRSAARQVVTEPPVFRLQGWKQTSKPGCILTCLVCVSTLCSAFKDLLCLYSCYCVIRFFINATKMSHCFNGKRVQVKCLVTQFLSIVKKTLQKTEHFVKNAPVSATSGFLLYICLNMNPQLATDFIRRTVVTNQTLVAVATSDVSFAGAVPTDLVTRSSHHDDATWVTVAGWRRQTHAQTHMHAQQHTQRIRCCRLCGFIF